MAQRPLDEVGHWSSPPPSEAPLVQPSSVLRISPPKLSSASPPALARENYLLHPAFLPPCEHGRDGDMHAHAFDLLSLSNGSPAPSLSLLSPPVASEAIPASIPSHPSSVLSATCPSTQTNGTLSNGSAAGSAPKPRRMSSSTTGVLGRGKLGLMGEGNMGLGSVGKDARPNGVYHATSYSNPAPILNRRGQGPSPAPQLFDFAKTDRPTSHSSHSHRRPSLTVPTSARSVSASVVPASLPTRGTHSQPPHIHPPPNDDMDLDMEFGGDEDDDEEGDSGRSGSVELDMDMDEMDGETKDAWRKLALGTGSGGVKGRRKGMVFKCEHCNKEYRHPSCLVKHRWEHSPHWKEPTQLSMSKHQQVQMLEAAAILAHLGPSPGRALPNDKSLWPAMLSPPEGEHAQLRRLSSSMRSPPSSVTAPLTPSSLRDPSTLNGHVGQATKDRKSSPGSDSTTSSVGETYVPHPQSASPAFGSLGIRQNGRPIQPVDMEGNCANSSHSSSVPGPGTPHSIGSLPDMAGLHFHTGVTPSGVSPIPNRGMPMSLNARSGMIGGGMFGAINTSVPSSSMRSGADDDDDDEHDIPPKKGGSGGKSSSEEAEDRRKTREGEEWGMAMEMEL